MTERTESGGAGRPVSEGLPRISIATPSFNQGRFLERAINSVLEQDYPNTEFVVMDGGSTDESLEVIQRYASRIDRWRSGPDGGQSAAINTAWKDATGDVLAWLNSDDAYLPGTLKVVGAWFRDHPSQCVLVDERGREIARVGRPYSRRRMLLSHQPIPQPSAFLRRELLDRIGLLDERLDYVMDYELFLRAAAVDAPAFVARPLSLATVHAASKTLAGRDRMVAERQAIRRRYARGLERPVVACQPIASSAYHALPAALRRPIDRLRPSRSADEAQA
jgi:glycosyltransferase involved in cell wall biosynthesis